jgi:pimeloyl-ACP methyl ester carboxylesterase
MPHVVSSDGVRIHYESTGDGAPVVLLHPNHATTRSWIELGWFDALQEIGCRPVGLDARGFGESDAVSDPARLRPGTSTEDVAAVLDALGIEAAHLCGFSLGAAVALRFAVDLPGRSWSLVLGGLAVGPLAQCGLCVGPDVEEARQRALADVDRRLRATSAGERDYFAAARSVIATAPLRGLAGADLAPPVLGVSGAEDPYDPGALYAALRATGARLQAETIADARHGSCFPHPDFRRAAVAFLASQTVAGA